MKTLPNCGQLELRESPVEGVGVFAKSDIKAGTILEEVPFVLFPRYVMLAQQIFNVMRAHGWVNPKELFMENLRLNLKFKEPERYYFKWHPPVQFDGDSMFTVLPLGFGPCYNTSNTNNNADWKMLTETFLFRAEKDIKKDDEIRTFYGYFLGEDGTIFNCDAVFHLAIDMFPQEDGKLVHKAKMLRFGSLDTFQTQRANPAAVRIHQCMMQSVNGLSLKRLSLFQSNGDQVTTTGELPADIKLTALYQKLAEYKLHPAPVIQFKFEFVDVVSKTLMTEDILWKK